MALRFALEKPLTQVVMSNMVNRITSSIATLACSVLWVVILVALPFIEEYFNPPGPNDSWQRGLIITPFIIVPALVVFYHITKKTINSGHVSFLRFIGLTSFYGILVLLSFGLPTFIIALIIKAMPLAALITVSSYIVAVIYLTQLLPLSIWWLIALRSHNPSRQRMASPPAA